MESPQDTPAADASEVDASEVDAPEVDAPEVGAPRARGRVRVTSVAGTCAALLLGSCFFLDWVRIERGLGVRFLEGIEKAAGDPEERSPVEKHFEALGHTLEDDGALTGMDVIFWVRTAGAYGDSIESSRARAEDARTQRILVIGKWLLHALLFAAFLLGAYFLFHGFRRATAPILILCVLVGATAVVLAGGMHYAFDLVRDALGGAAQGVSLAAGPKVLLAGGSLLVLAGLFGVSGRNFYRVYVGVGVTALALLVLGQRFLETGSLP